MPESIQCHRAEQAVWKGISPFAEIQIGGNNGGLLFLPFSDQVMKILVVRWA